MEIPSFCTRTTVFGGIRLCRIALDLVANWMRIRVLQFATATDTTAIYYSVLLQWTVIDTI